MRKFTVFTFAFLGWMSAAAGDGVTEEFLGDASLAYPDGIHVSSVPRTVDITWDNQEILLVDPKIDEIGDEYVTTYITLGEGEKFPVNSYIMYSYGDPEDPEDNDIWMLELALYDVDAIYMFDGEDFTLFIPEGVVENVEGLPNPAQEITFKILPIYKSVNVTPKSGSKLYAGNAIVKIGFDGNEISALQSEAMVMSADPQVFFEMPLKFGERASISDGKELVLDLSGLDAGEYEVVIPEGLLEIIVGDRSYMNNELWFEYEISEEEDGIRMITGQDFRGDVYTLQGIRVKINATTEDIKNLPPGIYVTGKKKIRK